MSKTNWSSDIPNIYGWYWFRSKKEDEPTIIKVEIIAGEVVGWWFDMHPIDMDGHWYGPIEVPVNTS